MQKRVNLVDLVKSFQTNIYLQNSASIQATTRTPQDPPALTRRGVVSRVYHPSRTGAVGIAEFVAVHIVLVELSLAIKKAIPCHMFLFAALSSHPFGTCSL